MSSRRVPPETGDDPPAKLQKPPEHSRRPAANARIIGAGALLLAGPLFVAYPVIRPYQDEITGAGAQAMSSAAWIGAHLSAVFAFILVVFALAVLREGLIGSPAEREAGLVLVTGWLGASLVLPYYGAETFGIHAIADLAVSRQDPSLLDAVAVFRFQPAAIGMFAVGLFLLAAMGVLVAHVMVRGGLAARWTTVPFAAGFVLFIPQFFATAPVRIAHGVLLGIGCLLLAHALRKGATTSD